MTPFNLLTLAEWHHNQKYISGSAEEQAMHISAAAGLRELAAELEGLRAMKAQHTGTKPAEAQQATEVRASQSQNPAPAVQTQTLWAPPERDGAFHHEHESVTCYRSPVAGWVPMVPGPPADHLDALSKAWTALENGTRVRAFEGGTAYQPALEDEAIAAIRAIPGVIAYGVGQVRRA